MSFRKSFYRVVVAGQDVTSRFDPYLLDLNVKDELGSTSDTCEIELADKDGILRMPGKGDPLEVFMGTEDGSGEVFRGTVDEVRSSGGKQHGRKLRISAKGIDTTGKVKEPQQKHKDKSKFEAVAQEWGKAAGVTVKVHGQLASIEREYWDMRGESFIHWGRRIADELGAFFKVSGDRAMFVPTNDGQTVSGQGAPTVRAAWGDNLLEWDIAPIVGRPSYKEATVRFFDRNEGVWKQEKAQISGADVKAGSTFKFSGPDKGQAKIKADNEKKKSERKGAEGSVDIVGNPSARAGGRCIVAGIRSGIDGMYRIKSAQHRLNKKSGYLTSLTLDQAQDGAGKDSR